MKNRDVETVPAINPNRRYKVLYVAAFKHVGRLGFAKFTNVTFAEALILGRASFVFQMAKLSFEFEEPKSFRQRLIEADAMIKTMNIEFYISPKYRHACTKANACRAKGEDPKAYR